MTEKRRSKEEIEIEKIQKAERKSERERARKEKLEEKERKKNGNYPLTSSKNSAILILDT